ncbi:MAG TPA: FtsQ-type POTRA domain-containing protein [Bryobacteraceae bacterium]|nr:FtsQ-type POTRA domain-containing protein [Bryobacteraceae bacterium]
MARAVAAKKGESDSTGRGWRIWLRVFVWSCAFAGLAWGGIEVRSFLRADARFSLDCDPQDASCASLDVHGVKYANSERIRSIFVKDYGASIFRIPLDERRRSLLGIDWVATAAISRVWPNRIVISVTERTPVAFARIPTAGSTRNFLALVDAEGALMALPPRVRFHLPVVSGLTESQTDAERQLRVKAMQHLLADLGPRAQDVSEVNASSIQEMRVIAAVDGRGVELWLGDQHYLSRFQNFLSHYADIRKTSDASVFDLRLDDRILAK